MLSMSLYAGYPRSPFKFPAFINALLFLCHTSGLKLFPGGSVLLRPSSNAGLHSRYLLQPSTNVGLLSELQRRTISEVSYHHGSKKLKEFSRA